MILVERAVEILPGVHWINIKHCNCYILAGKELTLIDTGFPRHAGTILKYIRTELHRSIFDLKTIILTHCDFDHVGNAKELRTITGASIATHREEVAYLEGRKMRLGPQGARWEVNAVYQLTASLMGLMKVLPLCVDIHLDDGDTIAGFRVIHVPGHTPGSIALYDSMRRILFTGDTMVYHNGKVHGSITRVTMDPEKACHSFNRLLSLDFDVMLAGHGKPLRPNASARIKALTRSNHSV